MTDNRVYTHFFYKNNYNSVCEDLDVRAVMCVCFTCL